MKRTSSYTNGKVKVTLTDSENDETFNMALTVKVNVPGTWESAVNKKQKIPIIFSYLVLIIISERHGEGSSHRR